MGDYKFGSSAVDNVMFGTEQVEKIYIGTTLVWENYVPPVRSYTFDSNTQSWTGCNWTSSGKDGGGVHFGVTARSPANILSPATHIIKFWAKWVNDGGLVANLNVRIGSGTIQTVAMPAAGVWEYFEVTCPKSGFVGHDISIAVGSGAGGDYTIYADQVEAWIA